MQNSKTLIAAVAISASLHVAAFIIPHSGDRRADASQKGFVFLPIIKESAPPAPKAAAPKSNAPLKTSPDGILPRRQPGRKAVQESKPAARPAPALPVRQVVSSQELLSDPQSGKIFSEYFQAVKSRIQTVAARRQQYIVQEHGKIELYFVLDPGGKIVSVDAKPDDTARYNPLLISHAMDIIRESEPFLRFPAQITAPSISFNITLVFDG